MAGPSLEAIEEVVSSLGIQTTEHSHHFALKDEGEVGAFLGIQIEKKTNSTFCLTQTGLINKVLEASGMSECNACLTPAVVTNMGSDKDGEPYSEDWEYASIVGMLMYLSNNSRPDIAFAVHQCARFTHGPKQSHANAVKRILRYLKGTADKGMMLTPLDGFQVDCYVDADFSGLFRVELDQDPICVKSRT